MKLANFSLARGFLTVVTVGVAFLACYTVLPWLVEAKLGRAELLSCLLLTAVLVVGIYYVIPTFVTAKVYNRCAKEEEADDRKAELAFFKRLAADEVYKRHIALEIASLEEGEYIVDERGHFKRIG